MLTSAFNGEPVSGLEISRIGALVDRRRLVLGLNTAPAVKPEPYRSLDDVLKGKFPGKRRTGR